MIRADIALVRDLLDRGAFRGEQVDGLLLPTDLLVEIVDPGQILVIDLLLVLTPFLAGVLVEEVTNRLRERTALLPQSVQLGHFHLLLLI